MQPKERKHSRGFWRRRILGVMAGVSAGLLGYGCWSYRGPMNPTEIYHGVTYSCERLPEENEGGGLLFLVRVDLSTPGIRLFTTPVDEVALAKGWEYRLNYVRAMVHDQGLAVSVNGTLFCSLSGYFHRPGDLAKGVEPLISDHLVNHGGVYRSLLWFDDTLTPHMATEVPVSEKVRAAARWGIGSQYMILFSGKVNRCYRDWVPDRRTVIAIDKSRKLLWLACFDRASFRYAGRIMLDQGAVDAIAVDGGTSTTMAIGDQAACVKSGTVIGGWRPVANCIGVKAEPLQ